MTVALVGVIVSVVLGILCIAGGVISAIAFVCFKKKHTSKSHQVCCFLGATDCLICPV